MIIYVWLRVLLRSHVVSQLVEMVFLTKESSVIMVISLAVIVVLFRMVILVLEILEVLQSVENRPFMVTEF